MNLPDQLTSQQRMRYARNISVAQIGAEGQRRLLGSKVFLLGCGALGSIVGAYLVGAGVGSVVLADFDTIDLCNLQRQVLYTESEAGKPKVAALAGHLRELNSEVEVVAVEQLINMERARVLFADCDFVVDASDNPDTKYMIDAVCHELGLPYCMAGVLGLGGQVLTHVPGSARYSDFFPEGAGAGYTPCSIGGIVGPVAGIIASIQALETIKYLTGAGELLTDRLLVFDGATLRFTEFTI